MGRKQTVTAEAGQEFGRLTVSELGKHPKSGRPAALVVCRGTAEQPHEPVAKWVTLFPLVRGMVLSCGCLHREKASQQTSDTPQAQRMRDWRERRNSPDYQPKAQWRTDDEGRECSYSGRGSCGHAYKPWSAYSSGETRCKACMVVKAAEYLEHEPDEARLRRAERQRAYLKTEPGRAANRRARLKYRYGITEEQYLWLLEQQDGACFLCGNGETVPHHASGDLMRLGVEHAHDCDQGHDPEKGCPACVRSLACYNCNVFMGRVERSPRLAARFADYLVRRPLLSWKQ